MTDWVLFVVFVILAITGLSVFMLGVGLVLGRLLGRYEQKEVNGEE